MPRVFIRPDSPYDNAPLPNDKKYTNITAIEKRPPKAQEFDDEANYYIDSMTLLSQDIDGVVAGNIPGMNNPNNAGKFFTTDGAGTGSFAEITGNSFGDGSIPGRKMQPQSIGTLQLQDGIIGEDQLRNRSVTDGKIDDDAVGAGNIKNGAITNPKLGALVVTADKIAPNAVLTEKIPDGAITNPKLGALAVTADKMALKTITFSQMSNSLVATKVDQEAPISLEVFVTPARQQYHPSAMKARVVFDGTTGAILDSYEIDSVNKVSTGTFDITFETPFDTNIYNVAANAAIAGTARFVVVDYSSPPTATTMRIKVYAINNQVADSSVVYCTFFGDQ
jgi:hypothetical protein